MTDGLGLALLGGGVTLAAGIMKFIPQRKESSGTAAHVCNAHSGLVENIASLKTSIVGIDSKLDKLHCTQQATAVTVAEIKLILEELR